MSNTLIASYVGQGLLANRPATPTIDTGTIGFYYATDKSQMSAYANGAWSLVGGGGASPFSPPAAATFSTIINTGSASPAPAVVDTPTGMQFSSGPPGSGDNIRAALKNVINATTFTVIMGMRITLAPANFRSMGLMLTDGTKYTAILLQMDSAVWTLHVGRWSTGSSFSANEYSIARGFPLGGGDVFFKVQGDGTNLIFFYSFDGQSWIEVYHETLTAFLSTLTKYGVGGDANQSESMTVADQMYATVFYFSESNP